MLVYLFLINAASFLLMLADKLKAKKNKRRIPESTLMATAVIGGSLGVLMGMGIAFHKIHNPKFTVGIPILLTIQIILMIFMRQMIFH